MKKLIIDTATDYLFVGLINDQKQDFIYRIGKNDNAAFLVEKIKELLERNNLLVDEITTIIVGVGPGSYTGIRVAVVVAKTLAYAKGITLEQISSLNLLTSGYDSLVTAAIDARRGFYFCGSYHHGKEVKEDRYISKEELNEDVIIINQSTIKIKLDIISKNAKIVKDIHNLEPNYLRKTEAERTYDQKNDFKWHFWNH